MTTKVAEITEIFCPSTFEPLVGETFVVSGSEQLILIEVKVLRSATQEELARGRPVRQAFSLLFRSQHSHPMRTGIHTISHPGLGELLLAINPIHYPQGAQATHSIYYECVFG